ncbi:MAG: hypothetical protein ACE1Y4_01870, partial [Lysobacterales bacterium]
PAEPGAGNGRSYDVSPDAHPLTIVSQRTSPKISTARLDLAPAPSDPHVELVPSALLHSSWCIGQEVSTPKLMTQVFPSGSDIQERFRIMAYQAIVERE